MLTIAVCDDNIQFAQKLIERLRKLCALKLPDRIVCQTALTFSSCDDVLDYLKNNTIDILFLDINMPTKTGFDLAEKLNQQYPDTMIIFVSAYENFVYSSFEYNPFRFLRKSHLEEELPKVFLKAIEHCMTTEETLNFTTLDGEVSLHIKNIYYFEGQKNYYLIHTSSTVYRCRGTISQVEELTKNLDFYRIHAAYVVNIANIDTFVTLNTIQMQNKDILNVSQRRLSGFKEAYMKFTRKRFLS